MEYQSRIVDDELMRLLASIGAAVLEGPKAVGKTWTASQHAGSNVFLDTDTGAHQLAKIDPALLLEGSAPRLIDEWQIEPDIWNHIRREVDRRQLPGQFILTGSAVPADDVTRHTGAGRFSRIRMRPMTLYETGHSTGDVSLSALFAGDAPRAADSGLTISQIIDRVCIGGWPTLIGSPPQEAQSVMRSYLDEIARTDIRRVDGVHRDPSKVKRVLQSFARNVSTQASISTIAADVGGTDGSVERETVAEYLKSLERLMIIEDLPAWAPALRSRASLRTAATRHFVDPCLAVAALNASPVKLLKDLNFFGLLFESLVVRDLRVYMQHSGGRLSHYRDENNLEVDVIIEMEDASWAAIEVKLGVKQVDEAAKTL
ncbi:MAG: ATP-binding protein, partial [Ilumatobacteraceae bacterium]